MMGEIFEETHKDDGIMTMMFTHKSQEAWESLDPGATEKKMGHFFYDSCGVRILEFSAFGWITLLPQAPSYFPPQGAGWGNTAAFFLELRGQGSAAADSEAVRAGSNSLRPQAEPCGRDGVATAGPFRCFPVVACI